MERWLNNTNVEDLLIVTSDRTWRWGLDLTAVLIKANLCHRWFWVNCKYSNTLRSHYDQEDQTCQLSLMQNITRSGSQDWVGKQMFLSEHKHKKWLPSVHESWLRSRFINKPSQTQEHISCQRGDWAIFTWHVSHLWERKEKNDVAIITAKPSHVDLIYTSLSQLLIVCADEGRQG